MSISLNSTYSAHSDLKLILKNIPHFRTQLKQSRVLKKLKENTS